MGLLTLSFSLFAQQETSCDPTQGLPVTQGDVLFNYGSTINTFSTLNRANVTVGQPLIGRNISRDFINQYGYWVRFLLPPQPPTVMASQGDFPDRIQLMWNIDPLSAVPSGGYIVKRDGAFLAEVDGSNNQFIDFNVQAGEIYEYSVFGRNGFGDGESGRNIGFVNPNGVVSGRVTTPSGTPAVGVVVTLSPISGTSLHFDGEGDYLCVDHQDIIPDDMFTLSAWVKIDSANQVGSIIDFGSDLNKNFWLHTTPTGKGITAGIGNGTSADEVSYEFEENPDDWHYVTAVYGGGSLILYVDGEYIAATRSDMATEVGRFTIGASRDQTDKFYGGRMDDIRLYDRLLTQTEIMISRDVTPSSNTEGLVAYWKFDEGTGSKTFDISGNGFDALIFGAEFSEDRAEIRSGGITDAAGFYNIESINYSENQSFQAAPSKNLYTSYSLEFNAALEQKATLTSFNLPDTATIEIALLPFDRQMPQTVFSKTSGGSPAFELGIENGNYLLTFNGETQTIGAIPEDFHHLAFTIDPINDEVQVYRNGETFGGVMTFGDISSNWDDTPWCAGARGTEKYYTGLIDEIAVFDTLFTQAKIQLHASLVGNEDAIGINPGDGNLQVYYPFNESKGTTVRDNGSMMTGTGTLDGATFSINTYRSNITPHEFSPAERQVNVNASNTAISQIDFTDESTIRVNGVIRFSETFCYQKNIEILVNGEPHNPPIMTNQDGEWQAEFNPGQDVILTPSYRDHIYSPPFIEFRDVQSPIAGVLFQNTTKRNLQGEVRGGECLMPVINPLAADRVIFELRSDDGCFIQRDTVTDSNGKYEFKNIPPLAYSVGVASGSTSTLFDFFENEGGVSFSLDTIKRDTIDFTYFSIPAIEIMGPANYTCAGGDELSHPVLQAGVPVNTRIRVYEPYLNQRCYLDSALVKITNDIEGTPQFDAVVREGELRYRFNAGFPNFIPPYLKNLNVGITTEDGRTSNNSMSAAILGAERLPGAILPTSPPVYPFYILRDPPGDGSFATLEQGKQVCRTYGINTTFGFETGADIVIGSNIAILKKKISGQKLTLNYDYSFSEEKGRETQLCVSTTETISTPESDEFVGSDGDTYIGASLNITYGSNNNLFVNEETCTLGDSIDFSMDLDGISSEFIFTEKHIKDVVIPLAESVGDDATATRWRQLILRNQRLKDAAQDPVLSVTVNEGNVPSTGSNLFMNEDRDGDDIKNNDDECPWYEKPLVGEREGCTTDYDYDGVGGSADDDPLDEFTADNCPTVPNPNQRDQDGDGIGDACDSDIDGDGIHNDLDHCPYTYSPDNLDSNGDGIGDVCETDFDNDGFLDVDDFCPSTPSANNEDADGDFIGDACEKDTDQDGISDDLDPCPYKVGTDCDTDSELDQTLTLGDLRKNITFGAGIVYESSWAQDSVSSVSESETDDHTAGMELEFNFGDDMMDPIFGSLTAKAGFNWGHGEYESNDISNSTVVGFTLTDDDPGDFYTVDVLSDPRYKTPVFKLRGGDSSCPFEGEDILRNRDQVNFSIDIPENSVTNVGENDFAVVYLNVGNASPSGEPRTYIVEVVQESNPDGAEIKIAGGREFRELTIPAGEQIRLVTTIAKGPVEFEYDSLRIAMYAECEFNAIDIINGDIDPRFYKEVAFDVQFVEGCPGVDISSPMDGWVITDPNPETSKLEIQLSNYEENNPRLEEIRTQYRLTRGSGIWINVDTISRADLGPTDTRSDWFVGDLSDGAYEVRAVTFCNSGLMPGSSDFIPGTLERRAPELFGNPEPADGVLSPGDEISITFNEDIRCDEIFQADGIGTNINFNNLALLDLNTGDLIDATITCNGSKIVVVPNVNNRFIENHTLRVITNDIKDLVGNESEEIAWEFFVNRSNLYWAGGNINEMVDEGNSVIITREIRNQGGEATSYELEDVPSWVQVFPRAATVAPGERVIVNFEFDADLLPEIYSTTIQMATIDGNEPLGVEMRVVCEGPDWSFNPTQYTFSMNLAVELDIEGRISEDRVDRIGAFVDGELRGLAYVEYNEELETDNGALNPYLAFLTVYSNAVSGETVEFQIWDASECELYGSTLESYPFEPDGLIGSPLEPQTIHTNNMVLRKIYLHPGWNWISYNVELLDNTTNAALASLTNPGESSIIKGQTSFSQYVPAPVESWFGNLNNLSNLSMYQIRSTLYDSLTLVGRSVNPATPIAINQGWNWIGYLPSRGLPVTQALASLEPLNGDLVKGQFAFAQYVAGVGWIGNLNFMVSPNGYLLNISNAGTLTYPDNNNLTDPTEGMSSKSLLSGMTKLVSTPWNVTPENYEYGMNVIAIVADSIGESLLADGDAIGAMVNGEVRGASPAMYIEELDTYLLFMTIYANREGEEIDFLYYDQSTNEIHDLVEHYSFQINEVIGNVIEPTPFTLPGSVVSSSINQLNSDGQYFRLYPNPARSQVYLDFSAKIDEQLTIEVTNLLGQQVAQIPVVAPSKKNLIEWTPPSTLPSGFYTITLRRAGGIQVLKVKLER